MSQDDRWSRMSQLVENDLEQMSATLRAFEEDLETAQNQLQYLSQFHHQSEEALSKPGEYGSVHDIQRQIVFIESLQTAMMQQETQLQKKSNHIEAVRQQVLELYQKKESYLLLAREARVRQTQKANRVEDEFLDDLSQQQHAQQKDDGRSNGFADH